MQTDSFEKFKKVKVLDCSIRDGGHLNKWRFDYSFVKKLYDAISHSGTDIMELGYRTTKGVMEDTGIWRHTPEEFINSIVSEKSNLKISIMGDIGKIKKDDFVKKGSSLVDIIRLAFYQPELDEAIVLSDDLIDEGYVVTLNLMGITKYTQNQIENAIDKIRTSNADIIYLADSFGSLLPNELSNLIQIFKSGTGKVIGFHPHNNLQLAFANTIAAVEAGTEYIDASINGMGRGAGNLPIETILLFLNEFNSQRYDLIPLLEFIDKELKIVKYDIHWGYDIPYLLSGVSNCHPTYSLELMKRGYSMRDVFSILSTLKNMTTVGFDKDLLQKAIDKTVILDKRSDVPVDLSKIKISVPIDEPPYVNRHKGMDFLIIANGPSLNEYEEKIKEFIKKKNPIVLGSNYLGKKFIPTYHIFNDFERFKKYISTVDKHSKLMIGSYLHEHVKQLNPNLDYEAIQYLSKDDFDIKGGVIYTEPATVVILMIPLAIVMGAKSIYIAGMDGYKSKKKSAHFYKGDYVSRLETESTLQEKMEEDLQKLYQYQIKAKMEPFKIITPTSFENYYVGGVI
ncbi:MAG: aldolase catalytic domain-containing protein [Candidatus Altiarchaeota archaeon]